MTGLVADQLPSRASDITERSMLAKPSDGEREVLVMGFLLELIHTRVGLQSIEHMPPIKPMVLLYPTRKLSGFFHFSDAK